MLSKRTSAVLSTLLYLSCLCSTLRYSLELPDTFKVWSKNKKTNNVHPCEPYVFFKKIAHRECPLDGMVNVIIISLQLMVEHRIVVNKTAETRQTLH